MTADTVSGVVARLIDVLEASEVTYALGGAIALAAWSEPRATADVDVVLWVTDDEIDRAIDLIEKAGRRGREPLLVVKGRRKIAA